jgi:hypothetical protein
MKFIQGILGCALAAGLMTFATDQAQASNVVSNVLYLPLTIKATVTFNVSGKTKKVSLSNKILLSDILNAPKDAKLFVSDDTGDVWAFSKTEGSEDLTTDGILTISNSMTGQTTKGIVETDTGTTEIDLYDHPQFNGGLDKGASETNSDNWFEITGTYKLAHSEGAPKNGLVKVSDSFSAIGLAGNSYFDEVETNIVPLTGGSVSAKGSGSLQGP